MAFDFKKIKSLFIVPAEEVSDKKEPEKEKVNLEEKKAVEKEIQVNTPQKPSEQNIGGTFDQKIFDSLIKVLEEKNLPGEDYMEFMEALNAMANLQLDENIKIQTVLATLSTKGLSKKTILESGEYYIQELEKEKSKFYDALQAQKKNSVEGKLQLIESLNKQIKEKAEMIQKLTAEIQQNQEEIEKTKVAIAEAEKKLAHTENNFIYTHSIIVDQIRNNLNKINKI